ncbi:hypothetical protein [Streptomyces niveus]|uniref:hypothetical protein n=1 Tax=Streptomyces niveus TaxID=193462 RepID=UPI001FE0763C|nr:hypothetical protein [Streptomyces niveus]
MLDFVGATATLELAAATLRPGGELALVGSGGGQLTVRSRRTTPRTAGAAVTRRWRPAVR